MLEQPRTDVDAHNGARMTVATFDQRYRLATGVVDLLRMSTEPNFREYIAASRLLRMTARAVATKAT